MVDRIAFESATSAMRVRRSSSLAIGLLRRSTRRQLRVRLCTRSNTTAPAASAKRVVVTLEASVWPQQPPCPKAESGFSHRRLVVPANLDPSFWDRFGYLDAMGKWSSFLEGIVWIRRYSC